MATTIEATTSSSSTCLEEESSELRREKQDSIQRCLDSNPIDLWRLRELALTRGGLVNAEMRQEAWHILVGIQAIPDVTTYKDNCDCLNEKELELIRCDSGRSVLFRYNRDSQSNDDSALLVPTGESTSQHDLRYSDQQEQLTTTILLTLTSSSLHYYQGLHDVAGVLLYNVQDANCASAILKRLGRVHFRDAMRKDLSAFVMFINAVFIPLLGAVDVELCDFLLQSGTDCCNAILPWFITWFTHDVHNPEVASRLVDAFMSSHSLLPLYFAVALLVHPQNRIQLFQADFDPASLSIAMKSLTCCIGSDWSRLNEACIPAQDLINDAITFMRKHPPRSLLTLAREYSGVDSLSLMEISSSVSLLRPPPSWAMASFLAMPVQPQYNDKENTYNTVDKVNKKKQHDGISIMESASTARAKIASGIPFLMTAEEESIVLSKRLEATHRSESPRSVMTSKWELCQQALFASFSTETCGGTMFCSS